MELKTSHIFIAGCLGFVLMNGENIRAHMEKSAARGREKQEHRDRLRKNRDELNELKDLSKIALGRAETCIKVIDQATKKEGYFADQNPVLDGNLGRALRDGATICNSLGDTAIVANSRITDIARVQIDDLPKFQSILKKSEKKK